MDFRNTPLWDSSLPLQERLDYLIQNLTLEEKFSFLTTGCPDVERLGITQFYLGGEAAHGIEARHDQEFNKGEPVLTTAFPQPIGMSATWDTELIEKIGVCVGNEARVLYQMEGHGGLCRWAPTVDMERDPRWGRTEESYGEDPYLTGKMSSAYIQGMKGKDPYYLRTGATLKHFYANNVEKDRIKTSSSIDPRNKHEYYLEPFKRAIMEGGAEAMMTAYNEINGIPCIVNDEVQKLVKDQWGLKGHIVCDGGDMQQTVYDHKYFGSHAETIAYGLKAGIDCFTDNGIVVEAAAREAYERGLITVEDIDRSIRNSFSTRIRLGIYDNIVKNPYANIPNDTLICEEHKGMTLQAAKEGIVLLKNENDLLPLSNNNRETLAVVGPMSDVWYKDWYCGVPPYQVTPLQGIQNMNTTIAHHNGLDTIVIAYKDKYIGLDDAGNTILVDRQFATEFLRTDWGFGSNTLIDRKTGKYLALNDDTSEISALKTEAFSWFIKEAFDIKKQEDGSFFIDSWNDKHVYVNEAGSLTADMDTDYATFMIEVIDDGIKAAVTAAKSADRAIVFLGSNPVINSKEEVDREDIILPPYQHELIKAVYEANPNTILVIITNYPYAINWEQEHIPAILYTASGSQELGNAIASILFGEDSPAGRLNMTWYKGVEQLPDINDYDIIHGKRTYQYFDGEVLYPFGYGLSYSRFNYDNLRVKLVDYATISLSVDVQNTGKMAGDEVVQIYVRQEGSRATRPNKQLKAFHRVHLDETQKMTVTFEIPTEDLKYFDVISNSMVLERGDYRFLVGTSSQDIVLEQSIFIQGEVIGTRDLTVRTACDRYDCYDNAYLHKGNHGYTCVVPKDTTTKCTLYYLDTIFRKEVHTLNIDLWAITSGKIEVSLGDTVLGSWDIEETDKFVDTILAIEPSKMALNQVSTLQITIEGDVKVSSFLFVQRCY